MPRKDFPRVARSQGETGSSGSTDPAVVSTDLIYPAEFIRAERTRSFTVFRTRATDESELRERDGQVSEIEQFSSSVAIEVQTVRSIVHFAHVRKKCLDISKYTGCSSCKW